jgi:hypothetical protein
MRQFTLPSHETNLKLLKYEFRRAELKHVRIKRVRNDADFPFNCFSLFVYTEGKRN